jgi:very-short-patch-repair endonuclease
MTYTDNLFYGASPRTHQRARELRKTLTHAERVLWEALKNRKLSGLKFRRQHPIYCYIADFYCHEIRMVVELDGGVHHEIDQQEHDRSRDLVISELGIRILRFKNEEVMSNIGDVMEKIKSCKP